MAGYSGTPLAKKIGIKDQDVVFLDRVPAGLHLDLDLDTVDARVVTRLPAGAEVTLSFHTTYAGLARRLPTLFDRTTTAGMVWVCWPKKSAQRTPRRPEGILSDLDENVVRDLGLGLGWVDVKVAAVDETWSALKFVRRLADR